MSACVSLNSFFGRIIGAVSFGGQRRFLLSAPACPEAKGKAPGSSFGIPQVSNLFSTLSQKTVYQIDHICVRIRRLFLGQQGNCILSLSCFLSCFTLCARAGKTVRKPDSERHPFSAS
jgi:hypothetical protein